MTSRLSASLPADAAPTLVAAITRAVTVRLIMANFIGACAAAVIGTLSFPAIATTRVSVAVTFIVLAVYLAVAAMIGRRVGVRLAAPAARPLLEGRPPTPSERRATLLQPWRLVAMTFAAWLGAALLWGLLNVTVFSAGPALALRAVTVILLGGLTTSALAFLVLERQLRPTFSVALAGESPERPATLGIRPRLLLSWALGSGIPLAGVVLAAGGAGDVDRSRLVVLVVLLGVIGLVAGGFVTVVAAGSVADPLDRVRDAMARLRDGDLQVSVSVDDGGEVGFLQAGFNNLVAGLRERERLRDLFGRHVGAEVARRALESAELGGEQREVSILFVDVIGSTALAERQPPAEVVAMLNAVFDTVVRVASAEGGWVNKFEGDAALCIFGAPENQSDHSARACRAARALRSNQRALWARYPGLDLAVGVSSGIAVAGNVGAAERYEYTVIGDPVNEAARICEAAKAHPSRVLAGSTAVAAAGDEAGHWRFAMEAVLRGRSRPTRMLSPTDKNDVDRHIAGAMAAEEGAQ